MLKYHCKYMMCTVNISGEDCFGISNGCEKKIKKGKKGKSDTIVK